MKALAPLLAVVVSLGSVAAAQAQHTNGYPHQASGSRPAHHYYQVAPVYGPGWYYHSSTAAEGYARGQAAIISAQGQYNLMTAAARNVAAEAHQQEIANRKQRIETYFAMREVSRAARSVERSPRQQIQIAASTKAKGLGPEDLNRQTGEINWPELLQANEYSAWRTQLDSLFAQRASSNAFPADLRAEVQAATTAMLAELKNHISEVSPSDYMAARRFVQNLASEA